MESPVNRRAQHTRKLLQCALAKLLLQNNMQDISVKDVTNLAGLNRSTFYLHYKDTYDLRRQVEDEVIGRLVDSMNQYRSRTSRYTVRSMVECVYDYLKNHLELCKPLFLDESNSSFWNKFMLAVAEQGFPDTDYFTSGDPLRECQLTFLCSGVTGIMQKWFTRGEPAVEREQMISFLDRLINSVLQTL